MTRNEKMIFAKPQASGGRKSQTQASPVAIHAGGFAKHARKFFSGAHE
jgi:hypothetical protein